MSYGRILGVLNRVQGNWNPFEMFWKYSLDTGVGRILDSFGSYFRVLWKYWGEVPEEVLCIREYIHFQLK